MDWAVAVRTRLAAGDAKGAASLFYLPGVGRGEASMPALNSATALAPICAALPSPYASFAGLYLRAVPLVLAQPTATLAISPILDLARDLFNEAVEYFGGEPTSVAQGEWILRAATRNLVACGLWWSRAAAAENLEEDRVGDVFHAIKKTFAMMNRKDEHKRPILIFLFAESFRIMFKLQRLGMFPSILTSFQMLGGEKLLLVAGRSSAQNGQCAGHKCDALGFLFYRAVYEFQAAQLAEAEAHFEAAWALLPLQHAPRLRGRVLDYLVCIRLVRGVVPTAGLLGRHAVSEELRELLGPVRLGEWPRVLGLLSAHLAGLTDKHVYVHLRLNLQPAVFLSLVKRTWRLLGRCRVLPLALIQQMAGHACAWALPLDEIECMLINLINRGWVKGHIGHDSGMLVLSGQEAFP